MLHDDFIRGRACGVDTVWTFGPYGFLYFGALPATYLYTILGWLLICSGYVSAVLAVTRKAGVPDWAKLLLAIIATACPAAIDVVDAQIYGFAAFALAAATICRSEDRPGAFLTGAALALCSLTKFSWGLAIVPLVVAMIVADVAGRPRQYVFGGTYLVSLGVLWSAAGQSLGGVPDFVTRSMEIVDGYSQAQQLTAPWTCLGPTFYIGSAIILVLTSLLSADSPEKRIVRGIYCAAICYLSLVVFKAGFVRHDHHEVVAAAFLVTLAVLMVRMTLNTPRLRRTRVAVASLMIAMFCWTMFGNIANPSFQPRLAESVRLRGLWDLSMILSGRIKPSTEIANDLAAIGKAHPLRVTADQTVDLYPWGGVDLLFANGAHVHHRPIFESYSAYTPILAELNRAFVTGPQRPNTVYFAARGIDGRFPAMDDGLSWPALLSQYDIHSASSGFLELRSRKIALESRLAFESECRLSPGTAYAVPSEGLIWISIDIPLSRVGRLLAALYRPSILGLAIRLTNGTIETYRLVPGCAKAGFLLSPAVLDNDQWERLHHHPDGSDLAARKVVEVAVIGRPGFERDYDFEKATLRISTLTITPPPPMSAADEAEPGRRQSQPEVTR